MKKLDSGLQFNVYELANERVLKIPKKDFRMLLKNLKWEPHLIFVPWILRRKIKSAKKDREFSLNYFENSGLGDLVANTEIKKGKIFQDKVTPLKEVIGKSFQKDREIIDKYVSFIFKCWEKGFSDRVYNFDVNNGLNRKGEVCLIDIGEITTSKERVKQDILSKRWEKAGCYKRLNKKTKHYYKEKMNKNLTLKNLEKYWRIE